jgi:hypothetical protein
VSRRPNRALSGWSESDVQVSVTAG